MLSAEAMDKVAEDLAAQLIEQIDRICILARIGAASPDVVEKYADGITGLLNKPRDDLNPEVCAGIAARVEMLLSEPLLVARKEAVTHWRGE